MFSVPHFFGFDSWYVNNVLFIHTDVREEQSGTTGDIATDKNEAYNLTINTSSNTTSEEPVSITTACNEAYNVLPYSGRGEIIYHHTEQ